MNVNLLDPSLGIQNVIDSMKEPGLPAARELPVTALHDAGLEELYSPSNAQKAIEDALCPGVGDGTILTPTLFKEAIRSVAMDLDAEGCDPAVREMIDGELRPLLENQRLFEAYTGLLIGG